ncbi:MAG: signal recognition particle-docking protein FtsY [bacterium]
MFTFIKNKIKKVYSNFTSKVVSIFSGKKIDANLFQELEALLLSADTGVKTTHKIIEKLKDATKKKQIESSEELKKDLESILLEILNSPTKQTTIPKILLMVGVNGSGKTTFISKLAHLLKSQGKKPLLVAGDTFRAAATHQLAEWARKVGVQVFIGKENQDPSSVIFDACTRFNDEGFDNLIIDTAGRLQTKVNLMKELEKMRSIINRQLPGTATQTWLTIDAMLGQNSLRQAEVFKEATNLNGIVLTKLDGTGKGGMVFSITEQFNVPITFVTFGEKLDEIKQFDAQEYIFGLLHE